MPRGVWRSKRGFFAGSPRERYFTEAARSLRSSAAENVCSPYCLTPASAISARSYFLEMRMAGLCVVLTPGNLDDIFSADVSGADCVEVRLDYLKDPQQSIHTRWDRLPAASHRDLPRKGTRRAIRRIHRRGNSNSGKCRPQRSASSSISTTDSRNPLRERKSLAHFTTLPRLQPTSIRFSSRACASPAQIAKVATFVNSWDDNRRLLDLSSRQWPKPVIVAGMGEIGQITRVIGPGPRQFSNVCRVGECFRSWTNDSPRNARCLSIPAGSGERPS